MPAMNTHLWGGWKMDRRIESLKTDMRRIVEIIEQLHDLVNRLERIDREPEK